MIRSRYQVKDSTTLLTELSNSAQEPKESESNYLFRLLCLKNLIVIVSRDEGIPISETMVNKKFFHALGVGLRKESIRLELQPTLNLEVAADEDLVDLLSKISARDAERRSKVRGVNAAANSLDIDAGLYDDCPTLPTNVSKEDAILAEVRNLSVKMDELATVKTEVKILGKRMADYERRLNNIEKGGKRGKQDNKKFSMKCQACETAKIYCNHCAKCGSLDQNCQRGRGGRRW